MAIRDSPCLLGSHDQKVTPYLAVLFSRYPKLGRYPIVPVDKWGLNPITRGRVDRGNRQCAVRFAEI